MTETITTFLIKGTPRGPRRITIGNKVCRLYIIPRTDLDIIKDFPELSTPGLYILVSDSETNKMAYIGETTSFAQRVQNHKYHKEFWDRALVFVDSSAKIAKSHVQYLEYVAIKDALAAKTYQLTENSQIPNEPPLTLEMRSDAEKFYEDVKFLADFEDCDIFVKYPSAPELPLFPAAETAPEPVENVFYCKSKKANAVGYFDPVGKRIVVKKDSIFSGDTVPSYRKPEERKEWLSVHTILSKGNCYLLTDDVVFSSVSAASSMILGIQSNGWQDWKTADGRTMASVFDHK